MKFDRAKWRLRLVLATVAVAVIVLRGMRQHDKFLEGKGTFFQLSQERGDFILCAVIGLAVIIVGYIFLSGRFEDW